MKKISIISPFYNCEQYIEQYLKSIIEQKKINLNELEILLIDDCGQDQTKLIVQKYEQKYPEIIKIIENTNNLGISASRNIGIEKAIGKYLIFIDTDDYISQNFLYKMSQFFDKHYNEVDIVTAKTIIIDETNHHVKRNHFLNKYLTKSIINVKTNPEQIVCHVHKTMFKNEQIKNYAKFNEQIQVGEDGLFMGDVVKKTYQIGYVRGIEYYYRKRQSQNSATDQMSYDKTSFLQNEILLHEMKCATPFKQALILYRIYGQFSETNDFTKLNMNQNEWLEYVNITKEILNEANQNLNVEQFYNSLYAPNTYHKMQTVLANKQLIFNNNKKNQENIVKRFIKKLYIQYIILFK